jgi:hypothetical protein
MIATRTRPVSFTAAAAAVMLLLAALFMEKALLPPDGWALLGEDMRGQFYTWYTFARESIWSGQLPVWNPYQFSGYPFLANPQIALFYPPTWLIMLLPVRLGVSLFVIVHIWLAGLGMFLFVRHTSRSEAGALLAGLSFAFSGFVAARIAAGHPGFLATHVWIPWLLLAAARSVERGDVWSAVIGGAPFSLATLAGNIGSLVYVGLIWLAFVGYLTATHRPRLLAIRQAAIAAGVGLALSAVQTIPAAQLILLSPRGGGLLGPVGEWSMPPAHLVTLLAPAFFGDYASGYFGAPTFHELAYYAGLLPVVGAVLALRRPAGFRPASRTWLYVGLAVFGLLVALGTYGFVYGLLYDLLLPFRLVRVPGRAGFLFLFAACALLGEAVAAWEDDGHRAELARLMRPTLIAAAMVGAAGTTAVGVALAQQSPQSEVWQRLVGQTSSAAWAWLGAVAGGWLLWRYLAARPGRSRQAWLAALAAFVVIDLWTFGFRLVGVWSMEPHRLWREAQAAIGETDSRVLPIDLLYLHQNDAARLGLSSTGGYDPLTVAAYEDFVAASDDPRAATFDILGAGYALSRRALPAEALEGEGGLALVRSIDEGGLYERPGALPLARLATEVEVIADAGAALERILDGDFDPATTAVVDHEPPCAVRSGSAAGASARIITRQPGRWVIDVDSPVPALLVVAETAYPGWRVTVDSQPAVPLTAYTAVRAVCVPAGAHRVEWTFVPQMFTLGAAVTLPTLAVTLVAGWKVIGRPRRAQTHE